MLELGNYTEQLHQAMADLITKTNIDYVITFGEHSKFICDYLSKNKDRLKAIHCAHRSKIHHHIKKLCQPGDFFLVKGSRSMHMEETVDFIKKHLN